MEKMLIAVVTIASEGMRMKLFVGLLVAALLVVGLRVPSVLADGGSGCMGGMQAQKSESRETEKPGDGHYPHHLIKHAKEIGLIPDQITRLKHIRLDFERVRLLAKAEIGVSDLEIAALTDDEKADMKAIEAKVKQRATAAAGLQVAAIKVKRDAVALLTAEQREKDQAIHEKMMEQMQERRGGMGGMGGGMMDDDMTGGGRRGGGRRGGGGMGGGRRGGGMGGGMMGGGGMGGGMMQGGGMGGGMDHDMMQDDQDDSSQQGEPQGEHQGH